MDHGLNKLWNGLRKLESNVSTIYNCIESLSNKIVTLNLINQVYISTIIANIQKVISKPIQQPK